MVALPPLDPNIENGAVDITGEASRRIRSRLADPR
jgi:hypothetical protein